MNQLTSHSFRLMILQGANTLVAVEKELNAINVFPVADGDTGTNMAHLMRAIVRELKQTKDQGLQQIKRACLRGSRGNSGMILSQFIMTMCDYVQKHGTVTFRQFVDMCDLSVKKAMSVVEKPVEGTILTVMKDWLHSLKDGEKLTSSIPHLLERSKVQAMHSLENTKKQLSVLKDYNVVDAGAKGFFHFIEGFTEGGMKQMVSALELSNDITAATELEINDHNKANTIDSVITAPEISDFLQSLNENEALHKHDSLTYRYCSEFMFEQCSNIEAVKQELYQLGDSIVFVGDGDIAKIHIHTNQPDQVAAILNEYSTISFQKVEDMKRQQEMIHDRASNVAIVVDSSCDLPQVLMDLYQIHMIPLQVSVDNSIFLDKRTLLPRQLYSYVRTGNHDIRTSLPMLDSVGTLYKQLLEHYDEVISIHVSSKLSGTYQACLQVANEIDPNRIKVIDSKTLSGAYGVLVLKLAKFIHEKQPLSIKENKMELLTNEIHEQIKCHEILVSVPSLSSMVRSGRVSPLKGKLTQWLNIHPFVSIDEEGGSKLLRPSMFSGFDIKKLVKKIERIHQSNPIESYAVLYTDQKDELDYMISYMKRITGLEPSYVTTVSPVIGVYAGSGAYSVAMMLKNKNERGYIV